MVTSFPEAVMFKSLNAVMSVKAVRSPPPRRAVHLWCSRD